MRGGAVWLIVALAVAGCAAKAPATKSDVATTPETFAPLGKPPFPWPEAPAANGQPPVRTVIALAFGWPDDLRTSVTRRYSRSLWVNQKTSSHKEGYAYTMAASPASDGLHIQQSGLTIEAGSPDVTDRVRSAYNKSLSELVSVYFPAFFISREGKFLRLENPAQLRADLKALMELSPKGGVGGRTENAAEEVQQQLTDDQLASRASFEWTALVGVWSGVTLTSGVPAAVTFQTPNVAAEGRPTPVYAGTALLVGHVPCEIGAAEARCVALEMKVRGDPEQLKANALLTARVNGAATKVPESTLESIEHEITVRVVADAQGLVPYRAQIVGRMRMMVKVLSLMAVPLRTEDEIVLNFRYPSA